MGKIKNNILLKGLSGTIGGLVFRQMPDGSTHVSEKPDFSNREFSQKQLDHQDRFRLATEYAREASKTRPVYAERARGTDKTAYNIALADWWHAPVIHAVELREGRVWVLASDDVQVTRVTVKVLDSDGKVLEEGPAQQVDGAHWEYAPGAEGRVEATAWDLACNRTTRSVSDGESPQ